MECQPKARLNEGKDSSQEDNKVQEVSSKYVKLVEKQESDELQEIRLLLGSNGDCHSLPFT